MQSQLELELAIYSLASQLARLPDARSGSAGLPQSLPVVCQIYTQYSNYSNYSPELVQQLLYVSRHHITQQIRAQSFFQYYTYKHYLSTIHISIVFLYSATVYFHPPHRRMSYCRRPVLYGAGLYRIRQYANTVQDYWITGYYGNFNFDL